MDNNEEINQRFFHSLTESILHTFYPKRCPVCDTVMTVTISTRPCAIRCQACHYQGSRTAYTPLHRMKLPFYCWGWLFYESIARHPKVVTAIEISRRLAIPYKSAYLLKKRFQLFCSQQSSKMQTLIYDELTDKFSDFNLPAKRSIDLTDIIADKCPVNIDSMAVFSASQRANKGRKRHRHGGCTASIYLSDNVRNGKQIGSLYQSITWRNGAVVLKSVPNQQAITLNPILDRYIPPTATVFSDEGYKFFYRRNHRTVNHSLKSDDRRYRWSANRWSCNGIHIQAVEGIHSSFKHWCRSYRYFKPCYSQLYADEYSFIRNISYFGLDKVADLVCVGDKKSLPISQSLTAQSTQTKEFNKSKDKPQQEAAIRRSKPSTA